MEEQLSPMVTNLTEFFKKLMYYSYSSHWSTLWSLNKYKWEWFYSSQKNKLTCHSSAHLRHKNHSQKLISFSPKTIITLAVAWTVNAYISGSNNTKKKHSNCWPLNLGIFSIFSATRSWSICLFYFFCFFNFFKFFLECWGKIIIFKFLI